MKITLEQLNYQQLDSRYWQMKEPESTSLTNDGRLVKAVLCKPGITSTRFGLKYIIKELCGRFQRAVPASLVFRDWRDNGLQHARLYHPPQVLRNYPIVHGMVSTINLTVGVTKMNLN